ncbi:MAG: DUF721 domain-containing protein [Candidatus Rokubacteria bacterium]|nr:DUF721 domain-containing protein [Candidatus Rokubacteria bacterium]
MRPSAPRAVGDILPLAVPQIADRLAELTIRRQWRSLVGPILGSEAARRTQPAGLMGDRLHVVVDNSPWLQEVTLRAPEIVGALDRALGPGTVRTLKVTLGRIETDSPPPSRPPAEPGHRVTDEERRAVDDLLASITDPDLAASMRRLLLKTRRFS